MPGGQGVVRHGVESVIPAEDLRGVDVADLTGMVRDERALSRKKRSAT